MPIRAFVLFVLIVFGLCACEDKTPPSRAEMRAHIVSKLSEEQIRDLHAQAKKEAETAIEQAKKTKAEFWEKRSKTLIEYAEQCKDIGFKTKNQNKCNPPLPINWQSMGEPMPGSDSIDVIFERKLMGICDYVETVGRARNLGCLP